MPVPQDADIVLAAVRLGWYVAEARGRNRPDAPHSPGLPVLDRSGHALPLRSERTDPERRVEAQMVLRALALRLGVDSMNGCSPGCWPGWWSSYSGAVDRAARHIAAKIKEHPADPVKDNKVLAEWDHLGELFYKFDAHIQDVLTASSDSQACGYQLGRALAECYWALDPGRINQTAPLSSRSWQFLLGDARCREMSRLLGRLSAYMHPYTAPGIAGNLEIWKRLAANIGAWKQDAAGKTPAGGAAGEWFAGPEGALYQQMRRWYELVILGQDPTTLIKPYKMLRDFRLLWQAVKVFGTELVASALGALALAGLAVALTQPQVKAWLSALLGLAGIAGFSIAGVSGRLKTKALAMLTRLRQDAYTDLVAVSISTCPALPHERPSQTRRAVAQAVRKRSLTPVTPN